MKRLIIILGLLSMCTTAVYAKPNTGTIKDAYDRLNTIKDEIEIKKQVQITNKTEKKDTITISAAGDTTLGTYYGQGEWNRFDFVEREQGYSYFLKNVKPIFSEDDLTIVNLEGPLTTGGPREDKKFAIKGKPEYTQILLDGDVEVVGLANNHTYDYGQEGYNQTRAALEKAEIGYFGGSDVYYTEANGIKVALIGAKGWDNSKWVKDNLTKQINAAESRADLVIVMFHWGTEREFYPTYAQKDLAYHVIDQGADLVLGSHPHVIQGIEKYKGKSIVYSMGNFSFGANKNPDDKDTFIYQETFKLTPEGIVSVGSNVIPTSISAVKDRNNYQPTPLQGYEAERVMNRLKTYSSKFPISYFK